ncbi:UNVERIFIED_CONTAM: hypothetical protein PYX00_000469 [Menopon gallinae]|uniref:Uncharacterized protein n=1 Tax=Menopon gallinae TaxID=328185 RepID=A0AAW2IAF0_9NEOP
MKTLLVFAVAVVVSVAATRLPRDSEKYTTKYDNVDLDEIFKSDRLLNNYINCLLEKGKCTPDGSELKRVLPDALETACSKCSEKQKVGTERVIRFLIENRPEQYKELETKYDPNGIYRQKYNDELTKRGIKAN